MMNEGQLYEMQKDNTYNMYYVKYDLSKDVQNGIFSNDQKPIVKELKSKGHVISKWNLLKMVKASMMWLIVL